MRKMLFPTTAAGLLAFGFAGLMPACAHAQNLVQNPGFEETVDEGDGSATSSPDWTLTPFEGTVFVSGGAHTGNWLALFEASSPSEADAGTLSQVIATVPSMTYIVSFYLENTFDAPSTFVAKFGGQTILSLSDAPTNGYQLYTETVTATSASTVLSFRGEHDSAQWVLDDISVEAEGALAPLVGGGMASGAIALAGLAFWQWRRRDAGKAGA